MSALWEKRRIIICVGTGGVGKTSVSAAVGLAAAASGLSTLVMTIDPARRLANALGLSDFGNRERELDRDAATAAGITLRAPFWAMMPDAKGTFDELIRRTAATESQRRRILDNPVYKQFAKSLAGTQEYAAVEKLHEVYRSRRYDLIVLDTPPSQNALDFLSAPNRIVGFLEQEAVQLILKPYLAAGRVSLRLFSFGTSMIFRTLSKLAGGETMRAIAEFVIAFQEMYQGFRERSEQVRALLHSDDVAFVLVTTTRADSQQATARFREALAASDLEPRAIILNRVRPEPYPAAAAPRLLARLTELLEPGVREPVLRAIEQERELARQDQHARAQLSASAAAPVIALPELPLDIHDLTGLAQLQRHFLP